ncbi:MAG: T9SS type A sorting domain-containing protein [Bacteroidales bacterium]|jgi:hypothetical protein|nr:T9SS type A sorting domain-containing protein [Bacteroidales bacterium]
MKKIILIVAILIVCAFQSWAQDTITLKPEVCADYPFFPYRKCNGLTIQCVAGWQIVDTCEKNGKVYIYCVDLRVQDNPVQYEPPATLCQNKKLYFCNDIIDGAAYLLGMHSKQCYAPSTNPELCDTKMILNFEVVPMYEYTIKDTICLGEPYIANGFGIDTNELDHVGLYERTINPGTYCCNCDSIIKLELTVLPPKETNIYADICEGDDYLENDFTVIKPGTGWYKIYKFGGTSVEGCDSTTILYLTVHNAADTLDIPVCKKDFPYIYYRPSDSLQFEFRTAGLYLIDSSSVGLCGLKEYVNLTVLPYDSIYSYRDLCQNDTSNFYNHIIIGADFPLGRDTLRYWVPSDPGKCDLLRILCLNIVPAYNDTIPAEICMGKEYHGYGFHMYNNNEEGIHYYTNYDLSTVCYSCDSIITLKLTVFPVKKTEIEDYICEGNDYLANGFEIINPEKGDRFYYKYDDKTVNGCDSTTILHLWVFQAGENIELPPAEICEGNVYKANGFNINANEVGIIDTVENRVTNDGCPYTITLHLEVLPNLKMDTPTLVREICGDDGYFPVNYNVETGKIDSIFVYFDEKAKKVRCENFVKHNPNHDSILIPLPKDIRPDNYSVTLYFDGRCGDTTFTVNFTVLYPSSVMEQRWNDVIILKNPAYNGGYNFSYNEWFVDGLPVNPQFDKGNYIYAENTTLQFGSEYRVLLTRTGEYQSFCSCPLLPIKHNNIGFPLIQFASGKIKIYSNEPIVELNLMNILGQTIRNGHYNNTEIEINVNSGMYILRLTTDKGQVYTNKIIVPL